MRIRLRDRELKILEDNRIISIVDGKPVLRDEFLRLIVQLFREGYCAIASINKALVIYAPDLVEITRRRRISLRRLIMLTIIMIHLSREKIWDEEFLKDFYDHISIKKA